MKDKKNIVAVIIPAFNVEKYISNAIESCIGQTYQNLDIIIVDDGSTDNTFEVASAYSKRDTRVRVFHKKNSGVSAARNYALDVCESAYVIFLDSDDWIEPDTIQKLLDNIPHNNERFLIASDAYYAYMGEAGIWKKQAPDMAASVELNARDAIRYITKRQYKLRSACYKLFLMSIIRDENIRFDQSIQHGEDGLFVYEYLKQVNLFIYISEPLWNILERPGSATQSPYNHSWLSSIEAVEKMVANENSQEIRRDLENYRVQRMVSVLCHAVMNIEQSGKDIVFLRKKLRSECFRYILEEKKMKNKLFYLFASFLPIKIVSMYCKRKNKL